MAGLIIRALQPADRAAWEELWQGYLTFYETSLEPEVTDVTWSRLMDPLVDMHVIGAEADGRLVGICNYVFHAGTWSIGPFCYLEDLFVSPDARGCGAGRALIEAVAEAAKARGAGRLYWNTAEDNATARRLYDKLATLSPFVQYRR